MHFAIHIDLSGILTSVFASNQLFYMSVNAIFGRGGLQIEARCIDSREGEANSSVEVSQTDIANFELYFDFHTGKVSAIVPLNACDSRLLPE